MNTQMIETDLHHRDSCRLCAGKNLELAFALKKSPIADDYVSRERLSEAQKPYPLDVFLCMECGHAQHIDFVDAAMLFRSYNFKTASSPGLLRHFQQYVKDVVALFSISPGEFVVEIGSNDGSLLKIFKESGYSVLGIDPARSIAETATAAGIETIPEFFTSHFAEEIKQARGSASIICANNVYAHIDNMDDVTAGVKTLLAPHGVFVFEVSYLVDTIEGRVFDTIYHEHVSHHSVEPLVRFFQKHGLELVHVERITSKGGSIRCYVRHFGSGQVSPSVQELIALEQRMGLREIKTFQDFAADLDKVKSQLHELLKQIQNDGATIAGFGASSTVTTLIYHFELGRFLSYLIDDNPQKAGLFSPGLHLPVVHSDVLYERKPDCVVVLAWKYFEAISKRHESYLSNGGTFVLPLPELKVFGRAPGDSSAVHTE
ncbi:MAG: class I SAM-dependent methyltransferase [Candidatus Obscuribacterales bacterium]|nr:class I SAM-dependent methyltransferase [Candidatus Obscuribacterales bacterium]